MREILFRGQRVDNGEWGEGYLFKDFFDNYAIRTYETYDDDIYIEDYIVIPETVGQFTGLKDKNGVRIFEGDIVDCWSEGVNAQGTVQQRKDGLWIIYPAWQKYITWGLCPDDYGETTVAVIGNIHDNPELQEVGE